MGKWSRSRRTVDDCRTITISQMVRAELFKEEKKVARVSEWTDKRGATVAAIAWYPVRTPDGRLCVQLLYATASLLEDYLVDLTSTPCNFGGMRYWFICPVVKDGKPCLRRVGKLYLPPEERYFGCRTCHNLTYNSCQEHDTRVDAIIRNPDILASYMESNKPSAVVKGYRLGLIAEDKMLKDRERSYKRLRALTRRITRKVLGRSRIRPKG